MERILYFDCFSGISGDMALGALLDLGLDIDAVRSELKKLGVGGYELTAAKSRKYGIAGMDADVLLQQSPDGQDEDRSYADVRKIIMESDIGARAKELALSIFFQIAEAEAAVHEKNISDVHFHEVGAVDSIVDIVGVAVCIDMLGIDRIFCSTVQEGRGFVACRHGVLPVPVPAVTRMLQGSGIVLAIGDIEGELVTPTGLGILKATAQASEKVPPMTLERVGYGFGKRDPGRLNALRVILGCSAEAGEKPAVDQEMEQVSVIEANIDDMTGEVFGYVMETLLESGARDVYYSPIQMKKNRPAVKLTAISSIKDEKRLAEIILRETTTLGVRITRADRMVMDRSVTTKETEFGPIRFKNASYGDIVKSSPEYEDCAEAARTCGMPLTEILDRLKGRGKDFD